MAMVRLQIEDAIKKGYIEEMRPGAVFHNKEGRYLNHREMDLYESIKDEWYDNSVALASLMEDDGPREMEERVSVQVLLTDGTAFIEEIAMDGIGDYLSNLYDTEEIKTVELLRRYFE